MTTSARDLDALLDGLRQGSVGAAARLITLLEEGGDATADRIMDVAHPRAGRGWVVGITGPPGAGKSSVLNRLIGCARQHNRTVGAILVDPSSPITGGAVLGDRIRMSAFSRDGEVFLRSMGSRGRLGGLALATLGAVRILDGLGKDVVFVETVGAGQADVDVRDIADTVCLVLTPGAGDAIQAIKAGIQEVNDIFVVNKCDQPGAEQVAADLRATRDITTPDLRCDYAWEVPICSTNALSGAGVDEVWSHIEEHRSRSEDSDYRRQRKVELAKKETINIILRKLERFFRRKIDETISVGDIIEQIACGQKSPQSASEEIFAKIAHTAWTLTQLSEGRRGSADGSDRVPTTGTSFEREK